MTASPSRRAVPKWAWQRLSVAERRVQWEGLVEWVEELRRDYAPDVELPPCWPLHEALRAELALLWYWRQAIDNDPLNPAQGVRWHTSLYSSADAWRKLATCRHEDESRHVSAIRRAWTRDADRFVQAAIDRARI